MPTRRSIIAGSLAATVAGLAKPVLAQGIAADDPRYAAFAAARRKAWSALGPVDEDVITYLLSPQFNGGPAWPTTRQAYCVIRPADSLIIASDGLSDLFVGTDLAAPGFGCEVFIECPDLAGARFEDLKRSWQFQLIENFAQNVADFGGINGVLEMYGVISMELPATGNTPPRWITPRGSVGALVGIEVPGRPSRCTLAPDADIRLVALTLLLPDETEQVIAGGAAARRNLREKLVAAGTGLTSPANRRSVLA
ncbi:hypothetical protein [Erythrobacter sp. BLCC-B19]|uniref:hypothetical protein n=1 Tax=Erythrobacter sp. BLCC-B19 TaxID=3025315 RepID=UPI002360B758|nr:hypothetical protein [Erythrobacter sp. BLCC-B19]WDA41485.1 hypothetical protein PS060_01350 [Erythrobacter sp. BLCC-B19]